MLIKGGKVKKFYICITANGKAIFEDKMSLREMQKFVDGYIEYHGKVICNEEGNLKNLPINKVIPFYRGNIILEVKK